VSERSERASLEEDEHTRDESRKMATDIMATDMMATSTAELTYSSILARSLHARRSGTSIIWPDALWYPSNGPAPVQTFLQPCDPTDAYQQWSGAALTASDSVTSSRVKNKGSGMCVSDQGGNPLEVYPCGDVSVDFVFNATSSQVTKIDEDGVGVSCFDVNHAIGPDVGMYGCHAMGDRDYPNQKFEFTQLANNNAGDEDWGLLESASSPNWCVSLKNAYPDINNEPRVDFLQRLAALARFLKSAGMNGIAMNDVNACGRNSILLESETLRNVTKNIGPTFER